ncbi:hypothetical protein RFI_32114, partial [Reticulomyxa filosa]
ICELLFVSKKSRYHSIKSNEEIKSLKEYVYKMEKQKHTYYITGASRANVEVSLFLEALKKIDLEVLFLVPIDESAVQQLREYDGKKLAFVTKEGLVIPLTEEKKLGYEKVAYEELTKKMEILEHKMEKVIVSYRMNYEGSSIKDNSMTQYMQSKKTMEINTDYAIDLKEKFAAKQFDNTIKDLVLLLFETTLLTSGSSLEKPVKFAGRIHKLKLGTNIFDDDEDDEPQEDTEKMHQKNINFVVRVFVLTTTFLIFILNLFILNDTQHLHHPTSLSWVALTTHLVEQICVYRSSKHEFSLCSMQQSNKQLNK